MGELLGGLGLLLQKIKNNLQGKRQLVSPRLNFLNTKIMLANNKQSPTSQ